VRQTDGIAVASTALAMRRAVKIGALTGTGVVHSQSAGAMRPSPLFNFPLHHSCFRPILDFPTIPVSLIPFLALPTLYSVIRTLALHFHTFTTKKEAMDLEERSLSEDSDEARMQKGFLLLQIVNDKI